MVKYGPIALVLLVPLAILTTCGVFSASPFPSNLPYVAAYVNLEDELDSFLDDREIDEVDYLFQAIRDDWERDVLFLVLRLQDTGENKLLAFNTNLDLLEELDNRFLGTLMLFNSSSTIAPSGSEFVVGWEVFDGDSLDYLGNLINDFTVAFPPNPSAVGFSDNFFTNKNYWTYVDPFGLHIVDSVDSNWNVNFMSNPNSVIPQREPVKLTCDRENRVAVIHIYNLGHTELVRYTFSDFVDLDQAGVLPYPYNSSFLAPGGLLVFEGADDPRDSHYTRDGIVIVDEDGSMNRYDFSGRKQDDWDLDSDSEYIISFDVGGDYYYYFNFDERRLYKAHTWWS
jgi:hypothetical protein